MASKLTPILDKYLRLATQATFLEHGQEGAEKLGDIEASSLTLDIQEIERHSREFPEKTLVKKDVIQKGGSLAMTMLSIHRTAASFLFMDDVDQHLLQTAETDLVKTFTNLKVGRVYSLGKKNVSITSFDDDGPEPIQFVRDTHYKLIEETGDFELIAKPEGATQAVVAFDAAAITAEDDIAVYGLMGNNGRRGKLTFYGINEGVKFHIVFWDVEIRPTGEIPLQGGDDYLQVEATASIYADGTKPAKYRYAQIIELKD